MLKRPLFWLGLLAGTVAAFGPRKYWRAALSQRVPVGLDDLVEDGVIVCNALGTVIYANAAAQKLSCGDTAGLLRLRYPSGQRVPSGQVPLNRVLRTGQVAAGAGYRYTDKFGNVFVLDITARPLPAGGVSVVFRDQTVVECLREREASAKVQRESLDTLCHRLGTATDLAGMGQSVAASVYALLGGLPGVRAEVFVYDHAVQTITRLASLPEARPKPATSPYQLHPPTVPFDASLPLHWQVYVAKQSFCLTEEDGTAVYALPLIAGGQVLGHIALHSATAVFEEDDIKNALERIGAVAALALVGPLSASHAAHLAAQTAALRLVVHAVAAQMDIDALTDLITAQVQQLTGAALCTLSLRDGPEVRLRGKTYQDALVRPERHSGADPILWDKAAQKAMKTSKMAQKTGILNTSFETGPWRAFAGVTGRHSVLAVPIAAGQGALTVAAHGAGGFTEDAVTFVQMLASLFPSARPASAPEAHTEP